MKRWEHCFTEFGRALGTKMQQWILAQGYEGWELVCVLPLFEETGLDSAQEVHRYRVYMKQEIPDEPSKKNVLSPMAIAQADQKGG